MVIKTKSQEMKSWHFNEKSELDTLSNWSSDMNIMSEIF